MKPGPRPAVVLVAEPVGPDWIGTARTTDDPAEPVRFVSEGRDLSEGTRGTLHWFGSARGCWCFRPEPVPRAIPGESPASDAPNTPPGPD